MLVMIHASPSNYSILKLPPGTNITLDADVSKWPNAYFIDSIRDDHNVFCRDDTIPVWNPNIIQYHVYAAHDDSNAYFGVKVTSDNRIITGNSYEADGIRINPGGQATGFYVWSGGSIMAGAGGLFNVGTTMDAKVNAKGNGLLPTYEFFLKLSVIDNYDLRTPQGTWALCVGTEDNNRIYLGIGVEFIGNKKVWADQWNNQLFYPTFTLSPTVGPALVGVEVKNKQNSNNGTILSVTPNPLNSTAATISFANPNHSASITIFDVKGRKVAQISNIRSNEIFWNGQNEPNGAYFVKLTSGNKIVTRKICLIK